MQSNENKKTLTYLLVAGMALLVAWEPWRPAPADTSVPDQVGKKLFPKFENPLAAKSLEIVTFNEETAAIRDFKVAQEKGVWAIPSHENYPADAAEHMAQAATSLMDLKILGMVSTKPGEQKTYGVITPDPKDLKVGMTGVGTRVTIRDSADKVLADLVIGKAVKDAPQLHYVREADRDPIYTVAVKTDEFSTKFDDWIEKDLLKLNAFDVREVELNDYSTRSGVTPEGNLGYALEKRSEIDLAFDDSKSEWKLIEMKEFGDDQQATTVTLTEGEELNTEKLNAMKTALDDLKIIDVERKPAGLSQDLKASDEFVKNREAFVSLQQRGFLPLAAQGEPLQIYSTEGEATVATKDGVKYVLRFGNLADAATTEAGDDDAKQEGSGEAKSTGPSRYLFVTAQFDENLIPKPEMQPMPGEEKPAEAQAEEPKSDETPAAEDKPAEEPAAAEEKPQTEEAKPADEAKPGEAAEQSVPETKTAAREAAAEEQPAEESAAEEKPAEEKPAEPAKPATAEEAERIAVEKENKRRQDEYDEKVKAGQEKVKELNERFADWYYIISDDVYQKIHLGRKEIIKAKEVESKDVGNLKPFQEGLGKPVGEPAIP